MAASPAAPPRGVVPGTRRSTGPAGSPTESGRSSARLRPQEVPELLQPGVIAAHGTQLRPSLLPPRHWISLRPGGVEHGAKSPQVSLRDSKSSGFSALASMPGFLRRSRARPPRLAALARLGEGIATRCRSAACTLPWRAALGEGEHARTYASPSGGVRCCGPCSARSQRRRTALARTAERRHRSARPTRSSSSPTRRARNCTVTFDGTRDCRQLLGEPGCDLHDVRRRAADQ